MGYPWGIGITKRFPNTRSIRMFPDTRSLGIFRHIPLTIGISELEIPNTRGIRIFRHIPQQLVFPRATKYPQYSYIQAHTPTIDISEEIPNTRSILYIQANTQTICISKREHQIPAVFVYPGTNYPQYSCIQAQTKQLPEYTNTVVFGVPPPWLPLYASCASYDSYATYATYASYASYARYAS